MKMNFNKKLLVLVAAGALLGAGSVFAMESEGCKGRNETLCTGKCKWEANACTYKPCSERDQASCEGRMCKWHEGACMMKHGGMHMQHQKK